MLYNTARSRGEKLSILGFGCMRLPLNPDGTVDREESKRIVRWGIDNGINYIDTAYVYLDKLGEEIVGECLADGYRDKVHLATKIPVWLAGGTKEGLHKILDEELRSLKTDHIDFFLIHALNKGRWDIALKSGIHEFLDEAKAAGKIVNAGFSHHDDYTNFSEILNSRKWDFCQIQYNYIDRFYQAGPRGGKDAMEKGMSVIIMEPLRGGQLAAVPKEARAIFDASGVVQEPAAWGLRWIWDQEFPTVVLSGMSNFEQVQQNVAAACRSPHGCLSASERQAIDSVSEFFKSRMKVRCTGCAYCMPCPFGVRIPECFAQYNNYYLYDSPANALRFYGQFTSLGGKASECKKCGACEKLCPQGIKIREELENVARLMESEQSQ
ncbi:MAG: aldo/keto reductase [Pyramidobacter sp.]|nr:aldo/keto reductase [Pyramidobacter sp.]